MLKFNALAVLCVFALNFKPLNKSFVYKGVSCMTIFNHHIRWLNADLFHRVPIAHHLRRSILIDTRAIHIQPVPLRDSWADSFKCNYFNRPSNKPSNFRLIFFSFHSLGKASLVSDIEFRHFKKTVSNVISHVLQFFLMNYSTDIFVTSNENNNQ